MKIDSIKNGIVLDHITAGKSLEVYKALGLDKLDCSVAIIKNVKSNKMGKKDILKIDEEFALILMFWIFRSLILLFVLLKMVNLLKRKNCNFLKKSLM